MEFSRLLNTSLALGLAVSLAACSTGDRGNRVVIVREANPINKELKQLSEERARIDDETKLGRGETKSWNERYQGYNPERPYQGDPMHYNRATLPKGSY